MKNVGPTPALVDGVALVAVRKDLHLAAPGSHVRHGQALGHAKDFRRPFASLAVGMAAARPFPPARDFVRPKHVSTACSRPISNAIVWPRLCGTQSRAPGKGRVAVIPTASEGPCGWPNNHKLRGDHFFMIFALVCGYKFGGNALTKQPNRDLPVHLTNF